MISRQHAHWPTTQVLAASALWGISGLCAEILFREGVSPIWLAAARVIGAGLIITSISRPHLRIQGARRLLSRRRDILRLLVFSVIALDGTQLTYFFAIDKGTVVSATLLQFTSPIIILAWIAVSTRSMPRFSETIMTVVAILGVGLVITDGRLNSLAIGFAGIAWGVICAGLTALYNVIPADLLTRHHTNSMVALSFLVGGVVLIPWLITSAPHHPNLHQLLLIAFVVVGGTAIPFLLYLSSLTRLEPLQANLIGMAEPVSAAAGSVIVLSMPLTPALVGGIAIALGAVTTLTVLRAQRRSPTA
jgi:drug/metabolite transporter (DMT)-like permease